jgi:hypothetical protein
MVLVDFLVVRVGSKLAAVIPQRAARAAHFSAIPYFASSTPKTEPVDTHTASHFNDRLKNGRRSWSCGRRAVSAPVRRAIEDWLSRFVVPSVDHSLAVAG